MRNIEPQLSIKPFIDSLSLTEMDPKIYFLASVFVSFPRFPVLIIISRARWLYAYDGSGLMTNAAIIPRD